MQISTVIDPSAFGVDYFDPTYQKHAENFLKGVGKDILLIVDSENRLQNAIFEQIASLPTKYQQQLQIRFEELFKNKKKRVVECCILSNYTSSEDLLELAYHLRTVSEAHTLIVADESFETLKSDQRHDESILPLSEYGDSDFGKNCQKYYGALKATDTHLESEAEDTIIHSAQFNDWLASILEEDIFASREQLIVLLVEGASQEELEEEFREFFEDYCGLAFELEECEESVLRIIKRNEAYVHLKHRVLAVEAQRKISPLGREARRMGLSVHGDPLPEIKVTELPSDEFRVLMHTLGNWRLFVSRERLVKLMETDDRIEISDRLRAEFYEFFVCYLELELFLENYDYDPDEGLELRPEFIEKLEREDEYIKSGGKMFTLQEVAKKLGVELKCVS